jgi:hypothetical protein
MGTILGSIAIFGVWWIWRDTISQMRRGALGLLTDPYTKDSQN